jgi:hypothetical protein
MHHSLTVTHTLPAFVDGDPAADHADRAILEAHPTLHVTVWLAEAETYGSDELGVWVFGLPEPQREAVRASLQHILTTAAEVAVRLQAQHRASRH